MWQPVAVINWLIISITHDTCIYQEGKRAMVLTLEPQVPVKVIIKHEQLETNMATTVEVEVSS